MRRNLHCSRSVSSAMLGKPACDVDSFCIIQQMARLPSVLPKSRRLPCRRGEKICSHRYG